MFTIFTPRPRLIWNACVRLGAALAVVLAVGAEPTSAARDGDITEPAPPTGKIETMGAAELAYEVLALRKIMTGPLRDVYQSLLAFADDGVAPALSLNYVMAFPDGTTMNVVMNSTGELKEFLDMVAGKYARMRPVLVERLGDRPREGMHQVRVGGVCTDVLPSDLRAAVRWDGPFFDIHNENMHLLGVAVEDVVMVLCERDILPPLSGHWHDDRLHLQSAAIDCTIEVLDD